MAIRIDKLTKRFRHLLVLDNITLRIREREFVGIVGPNGCGKSTLLKIMGGLIKPSSGDVLLNGVPPAERRKEGALGFLFQNPVMLPWRTLKENVILSREVLGQRCSDDDVKINQILSSLKLEGFEAAYPRELSGGMQQRAALARALLHDPQLLLMDEPFAAVDELTRDKLNLELLRVWEQQKCTVAFVTHALDEAVFLSDYVVVLTPRPAQVADKIIVDIGRPRSEDTRNLPAYHDAVKRVRDLLILLETGATYR